MSVVFERDYADVYDAIYRAKDYEGEADLIERLLARHNAPRPCRILDIGCGTGRHALALAGRGYDVTGIDRSPFMLEHARTRAARNAGRGTVRFFEADARRFTLRERFGAALMMFTVLGYQHEEADLSAALMAVRTHLEPGGLFIFDVWNGLAVMAQGAGTRTATATEGANRVVRTSCTRVEPEKRLCHVRFELSRTEGVGETKNWLEDHTLRYFFPDELERLLNANRLELIDLRRFPEGDTSPDERSWNMVGVAKLL